MENQIDEISPEDKYTHLPDLFLYNWLFRKGDDIQKLSIIQALPQLVRIDQHATFSRIVPKIQQELPKASSEFQVTTSQIFRVLIEKELPVNLLGAVIQGVDSRDPVVSAAWMDTLLSVIPTLSESVIKNEIIPLISIKSQLTQPVIQRVAGCRIIGKLAIHKALKATDIKKDILPYVHSLSQDCSVEVRAVMCMQLPAVAEGMGIGIVKTQLLPCFVELASDNTPLVREAAVLTLVNLFPYIEKDLIENTIIPLIKKLCEKCIPEDNIASIIASQYGAILDHITPYLSNDDKTWFLSYYKILARTGFETRPGGMQTVDASKVIIYCRSCYTR
ncbi:protein phosphatase 4 regulatory subunit 4 ppp4r4 [Holotrichia oblita]|uniref:Protein phosphatase 4 regulatory subunit 4 ppp4r4 n=2 Tax=Holotrichia oblita TaxID=644536 RepID=A0ACB9TR47_HOLOL|nr:protein phosphatase 4 regulatory subunit 4 ppp4r4 [Holotrichia oblita]KAI4469390.1 protein phosphatase 4 regulatory subunit 4 ppp4r4 [Holotrichia oblita]